MTTFDEFKIKITKAIEARKTDLKKMKQDVIATDRWTHASRAIEKVLESEEEINALEDALRFGPTVSDAFQHLVSDIINETAMARPQHSINGRLAAMRTIEDMIGE